jgi:XTP/dITP diphosphohydrolase
MREIIFVTGNDGKFREVKEILGEDFNLERVKIDLQEIQGIDVCEIAEEKAQEAFRELKKPVLIEDTGLCFEAWHGLPGALIKWFLMPDKDMGMAKIIKMLNGFDNRKAEAVTVFAYCDENGTRIFEGKILGSIAETPRGSNGFGWDQIFIPEGSVKTFGEMEHEEKNKISMRRNALQKLKKYLVSK